MAELGFVLISANEKYWKISVKNIAFLMMVSSLVMFGFSCVVRATTRIWVVDDGGEGAFSSIQEAINAASSGDVVEVLNGIYYEHVILNKSLSLLGENWASTVIDGSGYGTVIQVGVNDTKISGFTVQNGMCGISLIDCCHSNISLNVVRMNSRGVYTQNSHQNIFWKNNLTNNDYPITLQWSNDNIISANLLTNNYSPGVSLYHCSNNIIRGNIVRNNPAYGIYLENCENNTIDKNEVAYVCQGICAKLSNNNFIVENNVTKTGPYAIYLEYSDHNSVKWNVLEDNEITLQLSDSCFNIVDGNRIMNNKWGLLLWFSSNNNLKNNNLTANWFNFGVFGQELRHFINDVDTTNFVDGKPVYYWINECEREVPQDAGYIAIINSTNIYVRNLSLKSNYQGVLLAYSNNTTLYNLGILNNFYGLWLLSAFNNTITGCTLQDNINGEHMKESDFNSIYNNNFINEHQLEVSGTGNSWDNGYPDGGNYWSDYSGIDYFGGLYQNLTGSDGIGDTSYIINAFNRDKFPLMARLSVFDVGKYGGVSYHVDIVSNSIISGFRFNPIEGAFVCFNVTKSNGTISFCRVKIPKNLLWAEDEKWQVYLSNGQQLIPMLLSNQKYTYLYFTYGNHSEMIKIQGTNVITEFPITITMLFFLMIYLSIMVKRICKAKVLAKT